MSRRRRRLTWTITLVVIGAVVGSVLAFVIYRATRPSLFLPGEEHHDITLSLAEELPPDAPRPSFHDATAEAGLDSFRTFAGSRSSQLPEDMGSGAAWGDFDDDGDDDLFLVACGGNLDLLPSERAPSRLYENLGNGTFRRYTGFPETRVIGMGAAWGDYDADGRLDLVVTGYRSLRLFRNEGDRFVREDRFPEPDGYWSGAVWGDFDNDRDLDLYVCGYVRYIEDDADRARASRQYGKSVPYTLNPASYSPERNLLFRNEGNGRFVDVADELGVVNFEGRSLGALWHDFDDDGWLDLYVANDISDNVLYRNREGRFEEISHAAWVADYRGAMGLAAGDWNRDGDDDLFVSHWIAQENALYDSLLVDRRELPPGAEGGLDETASPLRFVDVADQRGLGQIALRSVGWGAEFADLDHDGWLDLAVANGSTFETDATPPGLEPQPDFLFWNGRGEHFHDLAPLDPVLSLPHVSRGLALSDYDLDGDLDLAIVHHGEGVQLLRNDMQTGHWLKVRLRSRSIANGDVYGSGEGARLAARAGEAVLRRTVGGASYLSQSSQVVHFGLGEATRVDRLDVRWAGGETSVYTDLDAGATWEIVEGDPTPRRLPQSETAKLPGPTAPPLDEKARVVEFWKHQRAAMNALKVEEDLAKAAALFQRALELNPRHEDARYYLASCLAALGDPAGAMENLEELCRANPQSHRAHKQLGTLRAIFATSSADLEAANQALEKALALNPEETGSLLVLGEIALLRGEYETAEERLAWACHTNPRAVGGFFLRGYLRWKQGDGEGAGELLDAARTARGEEWKPEGATSEGDVRRKMHVDETPLNRFWAVWDGSPDPSRAFAALDAHLRERPGA